MSRSSSGTRSSSASCSTRSLKSQPRELAVEVERVVGQVRLGGRRRVWLLEIRHGLVMLTLPGNVSVAGALGDGELEPRAEALALEFVPQLEEAAEQQLAAGAQVREQRRDAGVLARVRRPGQQPGVEIGRVAGGRAQRLGVLGQQPRGERLGLGDLDVAVVDLAEQVLDVLGLLGRLLGVGPEAGRRSPRGCSAAAWRRSACRAARRPRSGSAARGMNEHSSSSRTRTIRSALSASVPSGSSPGTARAFTARAPAPGRRRRRARAGARAGRGARPAPARPRAPRCPRAWRSRCSATSRRTPGRGRGGDLAGEGGQRVDVHVGVAPLAERVGELLDVAQHAARTPAAGSTARRSPAPRAAAARRPACRARARCRACRARRRPARTARARARARSGPRRAR